HDRSALALHAGADVVHLPVGLGTGAGGRGREAGVNGRQGRTEEWGDETVRGGHTTPPVCEEEDCTTARAPGCGECHAERGGPVREGTHVPGAASGARSAAKGGGAARCDVTGFASRRSRRARRRPREAVRAPTAGEIYKSRPGKYRRIRR